MTGAWISFEALKEREAYKEMLGLKGSRASGGEKEYKDHKAQ